MSAQWVFGYGSLIWRPDFDFIESRPALLPGYTRRFWQGSHDHRGVPEKPGRVVTLLPEKNAVCGGMAYLLDAAVVEHTFERLDHREKNGYERMRKQLMLRDGGMIEALVYVATPDNFAYLGEAPMDEIATQIALSCGPSGRNLDYLLELAQALRRLDFHDHHVFELESLALDIGEQK